MTTPSASPTTPATPATRSTRTESTATARLTRRTASAPTGASRSHLTPASSSAAAAPAAEGCAQWCGVPAKFKSAASLASDATSAAALLSKQAPGTSRGQCGMLWFTHPPRTGGSSAWSVLERKAKRMGWHTHDSIDMDSPGPHRNATWSWKRSKAWGSLLGHLDVAAPTLLLHHRQGMPGLSNLQLRAFLSRTKVSLEAKGCTLVLATLMRAPLSRALSEAGTHNFVDEEEVRAYSLVRHDVQTRHLVSQQPKPKAYCDPEHLATSRYRQTHHRLAPPWCYQREVAPLAQAAANLALYDLVGSRDELPAFLAATSAALGWHTNLGKVPLLEETQIRRGVSDGDARAVQQANQADMQLFTGMCAPAGARACDAVRGARSGARSAAWESLARG